MSDQETYLKRLEDQGSEFGGIDDLSGERVSGTRRESRWANGSKLALLAAPASFGLKRAKKESRHAAEQCVAGGTAPQASRKTHQPAVFCPKRASAKKRNRRNSECALPTSDL
jgi:hypothetical protein